MAIKESAVGWFRFRQVLRGRSESISDLHSDRATSILLCVWNNFLKCSNNHAHLKKQSARYEEKYVWRCPITLCLYRRVQHPECLWGERWWASIPVSLAYTTKTSNSCINWQFALIYVLGQFWLNENKWAISDHLTDTTDLDSVVKDLWYSLLKIRTNRVSWLL